jgi:hypothetical protein
MGRSADADADGADGGLTCVIHLRQGVTVSTEITDRTAANVAVIQGFYAYLQPQTGPTGVAEFFAAVAELQIHDFGAGDMLASATQVAIEVTIDASTPAGGRFRDEELHLWTLDQGGQVVRMRHDVDTAKHIAAAAGEDTRV